MTVVATLLMADRALAAADLLADEGVSVEVIDLRWLRPLDYRHDRRRAWQRRAVCSSSRSRFTPAAGARRSSRSSRCGACRCRAAASALSLPDDMLIPYSPTLEDAIVPGIDAIASKIRSLVQA